MEEKEIWEIADYTLDATLPEDKVVEEFLKIVKEKVI
jgi:hypothetical protein